MNASVKKEGFNLSSRHDFGNPSEYFNQCQLVVSYDLYIGIDTITQSIYDLETEDGYLQVVGKTDITSPVIIAQFKRSDQPVELQIKAILKDYIKHSRFVIGFPQEATKSGLITTEEFDTLIADLIAEFERNEAEALQKPPALTELFKEFGLKPQPNENGVGQWLANCPSCQKFNITFWNNSLHWGCPRCGFHGDGEQEFRTAMKMIRNPTKENKLEYLINMLVGEIRSLKTEQERIDKIAEDIRSGRNEYKIVSDKNYNLIFELLYGCKLEEIEPDQVAYYNDKQDINEKLADMDKEEAIGTIKAVYASYEPDSNSDWIAEAFEEEDLVDIEYCFFDDDLEEFVEAYNKMFREEELDCGNYYYETVVTLKATDGFKLHYSLGWTEGQPETGTAGTPYNG
ncbi:hypothetical protein [Maribellus sediminis]|uniref:hypothetical protein n=1 Tax=Maribellus sediminis TaxID=2696285 RepID=UPI0014303138|nr:hypothetical protein [Maribellus sediminis]